MGVVDADADDFFRKRYRPAIGDLGEIIIGGRALGGGHGARLRRRVQQILDTLRIIEPGAQIDHLVAFDHAEGRSAGGLE